MTSTFLRLYLAGVEGNKQFDFECIDGKQRMMNLVGVFQARAGKGQETRPDPLTSPSFCTTVNERVYITAVDGEPRIGGTKGLQATGAGGL